MHKNLDIETKFFEKTWFLAIGLWTTDEFQESSISIIQEFRNYDESIKR
jgi:hypothetical protein